MTEKVLKIVKASGIKDWGICDFSLVKENLINCRAISKIPKNAKSILLCIFPYKVQSQPPENISRYAAVPDYHKICGEYLQKAANLLKKEYPQNEFVAFIDNSPIPEVFAAASAGLGEKGKNGLLINSRYGSFVFIGEIVTDLPLKFENKLTLCSDCGQCKNVCPVGLCKENCLSKISQKKGELTASEQRLLFENNIVWGCDICAENCPNNKDKEHTYIKEFINGYKNEYTLGEDISQRAYEWRGEKAVARNASLFKKTV